MTTTLRPASTPVAMSTVDMACTISEPRPGAPAMPAMTAIDSAIISVWLRPAMMVRSASGN